MPRTPRTAEQNRQHAARMREWRKANPEEAKRQGRARYRRNKRGARNTQLQIHFGITLPQYEALAAQQNHQCAICDATKAGGRGAWHVDHDHSTKKIRGLLCHHCNVGLGNFRDNVRVLLRAVDYLRRSK